MCYRYSFGGDPADERARKLLSLMERDYPGQYKVGEIFPGDTAAAVLGADGRLKHAPAAFGFPGFRNSRLILNARSETAARKPTFAQSFRERRAILPADGFYEWSRGEQKTKYLFTSDGQRTLYLCGMYRQVDGEYRFVILTRPADGPVIGIHDRMPVIAAAEEVRAYLTDYDAARAIVSQPAPNLRRQEAGETEPSG